jgi:hypothetical protein
MSLSISYCGRDLEKNARLPSIKAFGGEPEGVYALRK